LDERGKMDQTFVLLGQAVLKTEWERVKRELTDPTLDPA
jgi:hypothetical protein